MGNSVSFARGDKQFYAKAVDIDCGGALIVEDEHGLRQTLLSEEVSISVRRTNSEQCVKA